MQKRPNIEIIQDAPIQSPNWEKYQNWPDGIPIRDGSPFNEPWPKENQNIGENEYIIITNDGIRRTARIDYSTQYRAEGIQWITNDRMTVSKHSVAAWQKIIVSNNYPLPLPTDPLERQVQLMQEEGLTESQITESRDQRQIREIKEKRLKGIVIVASFFGTEEQKLWAKSLDEYAIKSLSNADLDAILANPPKIQNKPS